MFSLKGASVSMSNSMPRLFPLQYKNLQEILADRELAALGDAYVNFIYSLALSKKGGRPVGAKVDSRILANAVTKSGLRKFLPSRLDRHKLADAAEALTVYCWLTGITTLNECVNILEKNEDMTEGFSLLLKFLKEKLEH